MILQRTALYPQMRLDVPDARAIEAFGQNDWRYFIKGILTSKSMIVSGFDITNYANIFTVPGVKIQQNNVALMHPEATTQAAGFYVSSGSEADYNLVLNSNTTNFVELDLSTSSGSPDVRAFWDAGANGGQGAEFTQTVDTVINLNLDIQVNVSGFTPGKIPLYKIKTNLAGVVIEFTDCRPMYFRLGSGGTSPDPSNDFSFPNSPDAAHARLETPSTSTVATTGNAPFLGGDKNIKNEKQWKDVVMTKLKELSSTPYWYQKGSASLAGAYQNAALAIVTGGTSTHLGKSSKVLSRTPTTITVQVGQDFTQGGGSVTIGTTTFTYGSYNSATGIFGGVSPSVPTSAVGKYAHQGAVGHLALDGGSTLVRFGQANSTLTGFANVDLTTNRTLYVVLSNDGTSVGYGMGQDGTTPIQPKKLNAVTNNSLTVALNGNYMTSAGKLMIRGQEFTYSSYTPATGVFLGVSPDPSGVAQVDDRVFQLAGSGNGYYHFAPPGELPGVVDGVSEGVERVFWFAYYDGNDTIFIRDSELVPGESASIGSDDPDQVYQYIGSSGANDNFPVYNVQSIANGTNLTKAVEKAFNIIETPIYDEIVTTPTPTPVPVTLGNSTSSNGFIKLESPASQKIAIPLTVSQPSSLDQINLRMRKNGGATGVMTIDIVPEISGVPGAVGVTAQQTYDFSADANTNIVPVIKNYSGVTLNPGTYYIVLGTQPGYTTSPVTYFALNKSNSLPGAPGIRQYDGTTWTNNAADTALATVNLTENVASGWPSGTVINLPFNSKTSTQGAYSIGTDELEVYENGIMMRKGYDYAETTSTQITLLRDVFTGSYLRLRIASIGGAGAAAGGGSAGSTLQDAYNNGNAITAQPGFPFTVNGSGGKIAHFAGDIQVDGVIDPTGIDFIPQTESPLEAGKPGFWVGPQGLMYQKADNTQIPISQIVESIAGANAAFTIPMNNNTGATIPAGTPVAIIGSNQIAMADADDESRARFFGITAQTIPNGGSGKVIYQGVVPGVLQGTGIPSGSYLWLQTTPGTMAISAPTTADSYLRIIGLANGDDLILQPQVNGRVGQ